MAASSTRSMKRKLQPLFYEQEFRKIQKSMEERQFSVVATLWARKLFTTRWKNPGVGLLLTGLILLLVVHHYVCIQVEQNIGLLSEQLKENGWQNFVWNRQQLWTDAVQEWFKNQRKIFCEIWSTHRVLLKIQDQDLKFQKMRYSNGLIIFVHYLNDCAKTQGDYAEERCTFNTNVIILKHSAILSLL